MIYAASVFAALAAALHVFVFYLEVFAWEGPLARKIFGQQSREELQITRFYAFNQGIYNLALAIFALVGAVILSCSHGDGPSLGVGFALVFAGCGSMLLAAMALGFASRQHRSAAVKQGTLPLLAVVCGLLFFL